MPNALRPLIALSTTLAPMVLAALCLAFPLRLLGGAAPWAWPYWLVAAPVLYVGWLLVFLALSAVPCVVLGRRYPKPRYVVVAPGGGWTPSVAGLVVAGICYRQYAVVSNLPLAGFLGLIEGLRMLFLHAYAPSAHVGQRVMCLGTLFDPDLTELADDVVVGAGVIISSHVLSTRAGGTTAYASAPVSIGRRVTIGGGARVELGVVIEEDAIVEPGAVVAAFTRVGAGEVWGGNPATFLRRREAAGQSGSAPLAARGGATADPPAKASDAPAAPARDASGAPAALALDVGGAHAAPARDDSPARALVVEALRLAPEHAPAHLSSETCSAWDSLGKIAIAAALFDRYGLDVPAERVLHLDTLEDVAAAAGLAPDPPSATHADPPVASTPAPLAAAPADARLPSDLDLLPLLDPQEATRLLAAHAGPNDSPARRLSVVIAATFVADPLTVPLKLWGRAFGLDLDCHVAGYDQVTQVLLDHRGPFAMNTAGVNLLLTRPEDLLPGGGDRPAAEADALLDAVAEFARRHAGRPALLVGTLPPVASSAALVAPAAVEDLRYTWRKRLGELPGIQVFDFAGVVERVGTERARNSQAELLMRTPYASRVYQEAAIALVRLLRARHGAPAKVVAVDCDNTLWGGVVGEVGAERIVLGPDGDGRAFQVFQRYLKRLKERGLLLAVVSRNEERDVRDVFARHPEMVLRPEDIAAWRVGWQPKSQSLREIAAELNVGVDACVFLDDDPAVRLEVQARLPAAHVVPLPEDPAGFCDTLARLWLFDAGEATDVDAARTRMMHEEARRRDEQRAAASLDEYLASLSLRLALGPPSEQDWARVAQLTQRTNQFSLSLKRRSVDDVRALAERASVLALWAGDRFGDYGLVGVAILTPTERLDHIELDTLLLSCRVLGRGVEDAFLHGVARTAARLGATTLVAPHVPGPRNQQVRAFLARVGFEERAPDRWSLDLSTLPRLPAHVALEEAGDRS